MLEPGGSKNKISYKNNEANRKETMGLACTREQSI
jgi:hypothetical protein